MRPGNSVVRMSRASAMVVALQSNFGVPSVNRRNAVGISIVTAIFSPLVKSISSFLEPRPGPPLGFCCCTRPPVRCLRARRRGWEIEIGLEGLGLGRNGFRKGILGGDGVGGFQSVPGDRD